jgi:hypothetical protein
MIGLPADSDNRLSVAVFLRRPISKMGVIFCIGRLSGPISILWFLVPAHISNPPRQNPNSRWKSIAPSDCSISRRLPRCCHRFPQRRRRAVTTSLDAMPSPPSMPTSRCLRLPRRCTVASLNADATRSPPPSMLTPHCRRLPRCSLPQCRCRAITSLNANVASLNYWLSRLYFVLWSMLVLFWV